MRTSSDMGEIAGMRAGAITPAGDALLAAVTDGRFDGTYTVEMLMGELTAALTTADDADLILPQAEAVQRLLELLAIIGGSDKAPSALSLVYREEDACAKEGLTGPAPSRRTAIMITTMTMKPTGTTISAMPASWTTTA